MGEANLRGMAGAARASDLELVEANLGYEGIVSGSGYEESSV
jgi:hypothetical protein